MFRTVTAIELDEKLIFLLFAAGIALSFCIDKQDCGYAGCQPGDE